MTHIRNEYVESYFCRIKLKIHLNAQSEDSESAHKIIFTFILLTMEADFHHIEINNDLVKLHTDNISFKSCN